MRLYKGDEMRAEKCGMRFNGPKKVPAERMDTTRDLSVDVSYTVAVREGGGDGDFVTKCMKPVGHLLKAGDCTGIITKKDATECGERGLERRGK